MFTYQNNLCKLVFESLTEREKMIHNYPKTRSYLKDFYPKHTNPFPYMTSTHKSELSTILMSELDSDAVTDLFSTPEIVATLLAIVQYGHSHIETLKLLIADQIFKDYFFILERIYESIEDEYDPSNMVSSFYPPYENSVMLGTL